jgi:purine nucleosidase
VAVLAILALATFAIPLPTWRTGELPVPSLDLVKGGPAVRVPERIWIDTDAACGHGRTTDPDDCLAILLLARAPGAEIVGFSTVFGNAPLAVTDRITRDLMAILEQGGSNPRRSTVVPRALSANMAGSRLNRPMLPCKRLWPRRR